MPDDIRYRGKIRINPFTAAQYQEAVSTFKAMGTKTGPRPPKSAKDFIHVHQFKPFSKMSRRKRVPLCPNCHAVLHHHTPPYTLEELQALIREARQ